MSTQSTIFLTNDNEHCYFEHNARTLGEGGRYDSAIVMEFSKKNIEVIRDDNDDLIIEIKPGSELYKIFISQLKAF